MREAFIYLVKIRLLLVRWARAQKGRPLKHLLIL